MEEDTKNIINNNSYRYSRVHYILSHSYSIYLFAVVLGVIFDTIIPINSFDNIVYEYTGLVMIIVGSALIYWAQSTSSTTKKEMEVEGKVRDFARGPYKYSRNPTHIGLAIMTIGLGLLINSLFSVIFIVLAFVITKSIFVKKEEEILEEKYGQIYCDYKNKVRTWL